MKVLMLGRLGLLKNGGGDLIQIQNTAEQFRGLGVQVEISDTFKTDMSSYDLVHVFQLDWTPETYFYCINAKRLGKPLVLSPIHHNIDEVKKFDDTFVFDFRRISRLLFTNQFHRDTFKNIYSSLLSRNLTRIYVTFVSIFLGLKNMQRKCLEISDYVLVQTKLEASDLLATYKQDFRWKKIPNGVSSHFLTPVSPQIHENLVGFSDYIVSVGRIEPRKNQLSIIKAVEMVRKKTGKDIKLVLVGMFPKYKHYEYTNLITKSCKKFPWIKHISRIEYNHMPSLYRNAKVCVSASWFETTGLTSLEALFCHTNAVASGARAREYLGDAVSYCDPSSVISIASAIEIELQKDRPSIDDFLRNEYTWENAAKKTLEVYNEVLKIC